MRDRNTEQSALLKLVREAFVVLDANTQALNEARIVIKSAQESIGINKKKLPNLSRKSAGLLS